MVVPNLLMQILSTRARKNVTVSDIKIDVCIYAFDILFHNGQSLIKEQLKVRREVLHNYRMIWALTRQTMEVLLKNYCAILIIPSFCFILSLA